MAFAVAVAAFGSTRLTLGSLLVVPVVVLGAKLFGLYDRDELLIHKTTADEAPTIFALATVLTLLAWAGEQQLAGGRLSHLQGLVLFCLLSLGLVSGRWTVRRASERLTLPERCLMIGPQITCARLRTKMGDQGAHAAIVARLDITDGPETDLEAIAHLVQTLAIDRLIVVPDHSNPDGILDLVRGAKGLDVRISVVPGILEVVGSTVVFDNVGGVPLLGVRRLGLTRSSWAVKRAFDIVLASLALLIAAPLLAVLAVAIRLDSRGPVFFRQVRIGRDGRPFRIFKFRTMVAEAELLKADLRALNEADGLFKIDDDPRVTRVGRWLRRTSLDELPQLINVLRGEMSMVGPRPLIADEDQMITGFDRRRLNLTPGMTGHWQILGSARIPLAEMVKIDYLYVTSWSLWGDIKLLVRTVPYMLARRGQ
ncbi:MAG: hypothetical protein QOG68_209 [Solirubrobacteraceae bacterium]|nr:hypothetical protein [Solirubrobacteraceae bacterium]